MRFLLQQGDQEGHHVGDSHKDFAENIWGATFHRQKLATLVDQLEYLFARCEFETLVYFGSRLKLNAIHLPACPYFHPTGFSSTRIYLVISI